MQGLGSTGNAANPHIDYVAYKRNIRNQTTNQMTKNLRIGLTYDMVGNISNQYWSNEHFDPTTGATINVNQYQYYYDKMKRLVGADYKTGTYTQNPFAYFDDISTNFPNDFICGVNELAFNQILKPIFSELNLNLLKTGPFGVFKLKYVKTLLESIAINATQECQPNASATVYGFLPNFQTPTTTTNGLPYDAAYWYSKNGNLDKLNRNDEIGIKTQQIYAYSNPLNNQLTGVTWTNISTSISTSHMYQYDQTGNLLNDSRNGVTAIDYISYNDMPQSITNGGGTKNYRYDNAGQRIAKTNSASDIEFYIDDIILDLNGSVKSYQTKEGFVVPTVSLGSVNVEYYYNLKDWLGTNRAVLDDVGVILNASDHYPYGLSMPGRHYVSENEGDRYQFTGHQFDGETSYEYHGARYYNRELGRYMSVDPLATSFFSWSSYNYTLSNPIMMIDPNGKGPEDWVKKQGSNSWEYDSRVQSQSGATARHGEGTEYMDDGASYKGSYKGESVGEITLNTGGLQTWNGGSYQNKDLNPSPSSSTTSLPNPFMQNWYAPGGQANAVFGTLASVGGLSNATVKLTPHFYEKAAAWTPGYKSTPSSVSMLAKGLSFLSLGIGTAMDIKGIYNYNKYGSDSPNAVHPAKAGVNFTFGVMGLKLNPVASVVYFGVDAFYPGGWIGDSKHEGALKKISGLQERNREIVPDFNIYRDF